MKKRLKGAPLFFVLRIFVIVIVIVFVLMGCNTSEEKNIDKSMKEFIELYNENCQYYFSGSVLISKGEKILYKDSFGMKDYEKGIKNTTDTIFPIGSITKSFTATAILQLEEDGKLDVNDKISKYINIVNEKEDITIHQLLTHTSGFQREGLYSLEQKVPLERNIDFIINLPLLFDQDKDFSYSNAGYIMLAKIIEEVSGVSYNEYIDENIFKPLEMNDSVCGVDNNYLDNQAIGYIIDKKEPVQLSLYNLSIVTGSGNIYSTVEDMQKYLLGLLNGKLISKESLDKIQNPQWGNWNDGYSYGFFLNMRYGQKTISHSGHIGNSGYNSLIKIFPEENYYMIYLTNNENNNGLLTISEISEAILFNEEYAVPNLKKGTELTEEELKNYQGDYLFDGIQKISVIYKEGYLYTTSDDGSLNKLIISENDEFYVENHPMIRVKFVEEDGSIIYKLINITNVLEGIRIDN